MKDAIYEAIVLSTPTLRPNHGSNNEGNGFACNNPSCKRNHGSESHRYTTDEYNKLCDKRYAEITRNSR